MKKIKSSEINKVETFHSCSSTALDLPLIRYFLDFFIDLQISAENFMDFIFYLWAFECFFFTFGAWYKNKKRENFSIWFQYEKASRKVSENTKKRRTLKFINLWGKFCSFCNKLYIFIMSFPKMFCTEMTWWQTKWKHCSALPSTHIIGAIWIFLITIHLVFFIFFAVEKKEMTSQCRL